MLVAFLKALGLAAVLGAGGAGIAYLVDPTHYVSFGVFAGAAAAIGQYLAMALDKLLDKLYPKP